MGKCDILIKSNFLCCIIGKIIYEVILMLMLNQRDAKEYPEEMIEKCKAAPHQIVRLPVKEERLRSAPAMPTLLEQTRYKAGEFSDIFEITEFSYDPTTRTGRLRADISLCEAADYMEITAEILDMDSKAVIAQVPMVHNAHATQLVMQDDFTVGSDVSEHLGILAHGKWGPDNVQESELVIFEEANNPKSEQEYIHMRPKKETEAVILGHLENFAPEPVGTGDDDHIVIALIRRPENTKDVDYICGYGRDSANRPTLCVPGQGKVILPTDETLNKEKSSGICKIYRKTGGAAVIAATGAGEGYELDQIQMQGSNNVVEYSFVSWNTGYKDKGGWEKTEFDYSLRLDLVTNLTGGGSNIHTIYVDSRPDCPNMTDLIKPLQIMFGCLAPDTAILVYEQNAEGERVKKQVPICTIKIGDEIVGKDGQVIKVSNIWSGEEKDLMVEMWTEGISEPLWMTRNHPVWVRDARGNTGWKRAAQCVAGEQVLVAGNSDNWRKVERVAEKEPCGTVYNLELAPEEGCLRAMFCNGILTGDQRIQNGEV